MNSVTKDARVRLIKSTRRTFYDVVKEAKITPRQMQVIELRYIDGLMNYQIANVLSVSTKTIENDLRTAYCAVSRVLEQKRLG